MVRPGYSGLFAEIEKGIKERCIYRILQVIFRAIVVKNSAVY